MSTRFSFSACCSIASIFWICLCWPHAGHSQSPLAGELPEGPFRELYQNGVWRVEYANLGGSSIVLGSDTGWVKKENGQGEARVPVISELLQELGISPQQTVQEQAKRRYDYYGSPGMIAAGTHFRMVSDSINGMSELVQIPEALGNLELAGNQKKELNAALKEFELELAKERTALDLKEGESLPQQVLYAVKAKLGGRMAQILLPHQVAELTSMSPGTRGLIPALVLTPVGDIFSLTDEQKKALGEQSDKVIEDLKAEIDRARERLHRIFEDQLTEEQRKRIDKVFPGLTDAQIFGNSPNDFIRLSDLPEKKREPAPAVKTDRQ